MPSTHKTQQARLERIWRRWHGRLGMYGWDIRRDYHDGEFVAQDGEASGQALASTHVDWRYKHGSIAWNTALAAGMDDERLEYALVHEIMHVWLHEMRTEGLDHEERVATELAWAFLRTAS